MGKKLSCSSKYIESLIKGSSDEQKLAVFFSLITSSVFGLEDNTLAG